MLKTIGFLVLLSVLCAGIAMFLGYASFSGPASLTQKGQQQVQDVRNDVADLVRGQSGN